MLKIFDPEIVIFLRTSRLRKKLGVFIKWKECISDELVADYHLSISYKLVQIYFFPEFTQCGE